MCGIAGIHVKERYKGELPLDDMLDLLLIHIAERGKHATGFVSCHFGGKGVTLSKKDVPADEFIGLRHRPNMQYVQTILAHTRWATQGHQSNNENNHPVVYGTTFATHNGHIGNDDEVVKEFNLEAGRPAEVDSIAIPIALASCGMDSITNIQEGLGKLSGGMACAVVDPFKHPGQVVLAKGATSPLIVLHHKTGFYWASTKAAIEFMWGSLIGTPPEKKAKNPSELGWYEFNYGEAWLIDGDEAAPFKFKPAVKKYTGGYQGGASGDGFQYEPWQRGSGPTRAGSGDPVISRITKYTCTPNSTSCEHPCDVGCRTGDCLCRDTVWKHNGTEYSFDPTELLKSRANNGCSVPPLTADECATPNFCSKQGSCDCRQFNIAKAQAAARAAAAKRSRDRGKENDGDGDDAGTGTVPGTLPTREAFVAAGPEGKVRCDSCWDWYNEANLCEYTLGTQDFLLCGDCAVEEGWKVAADTITGLEDEKLDHYQIVAETSNAAHAVARQKTAESLSCKPDFVEWILFKATLEEMEEGGQDLRQLRRVVEDEYETHYDEAIA